MLLNQSKAYFQLKKIGKFSPGSSFPLVICFKEKSIDTVVGFAFIKDGQDGGQFSIDLTNLWLGSGTSAGPAGNFFLGCSSIEQADNLCYNYLLEHYKSLLEESAAWSSLRLEESIDSEDLVTDFCTYLSYK